MKGNKKIENFQKYAKNANFEVISRKILIRNRNLGSRCYFTINDDQFKRPKQFLRCFKFGMNSIDQHEKNSPLCYEFCLPEEFKVDGFLPPQASGPNTENFKGTVFEFQGCFFHGYPTSLVTQRDRTVVFGRAMKEVYENTQTKNNRMRSLG